MCTIIFAINAHPKYPFILLGNRDEFKSRPSSPAHFHGPSEMILSGVDLKDGGIWTGVSRCGKITFLTNHRNFDLTKESGIKSRGQLGLDYLSSNLSIEDYLIILENNKDMYNPYNLIIGNMNSLYYFSNISNTVIKLENGVHGISNGFLNSGWYKTEKAKKRVTSILERDKNQLDFQDFFEVLDDKEIAPDDLLPKTGLPIDKERLLSSIFIDSDKYGTVFQTVILIDSNHKVNFFEKSLNDQDLWEFRSFEFDL